MLEKFVRAAVVGSLMFSSGCVSFKPYDVSKIETVVPVVRHVGVERAEFGDLSWEEAIDLVETPEQAMAYCKWLCEEKRPYMGMLAYGFKDIHEGAPVECIEAVYACAALLRDNGYAPLLLGISNNAPLEGGHCVFLYKTNEGFGSGGFNRSDWIPPQFNSVNDLAKEVARRREEAGGHVYHYYDVFNVEEFDPEFLTRGPRLHVFTCNKKME